MLRRSIPFLALIALLGSAPARALDDGEVFAPLKISATSGAFGGTLSDGDGFGTSVTAIGDLNGDGLTDLAVGTPGDDENGMDRGAVWIVFLRANGTVKFQQKINDSIGGLTGGLVNGARFGTSVSAFGDLNGDGRLELAVGAPTTGNHAQRGRVYVLFLNADGTVGSQTVLGQGLGGFSIPIALPDPFGTSVSGMGDIDGNGVPDLAIGRTDDGSIFHVLMNANGTAKSNWEIGLNLGGFGGIPTPHFGTALHRLGDLDGDGVDEIVVGDTEADCLPCPGGWWVLYVNPNGTVKNEVQVRGYDDIFDGFAHRSELGSDLAVIGDIDEDGQPDLAIGGRVDSNIDGFSFPDPNFVDEAGALWIVGLAGDGTGSWAQKISPTEGNFSGFLEEFDHFGAGVSAIGDLNGDGIVDVVAGAPGDDDGGPDRGAIYLLTLQGESLLPVETQRAGTPPNPMALLPGATQGPALGEVWDPSIDHTSFFPGALLDFFGVGVGATNIPSPIGTVLCIDNFFTRYRAPGVPLNLPIPFDTSLVGANLCVTGGSLDLATIQLTNALDIELGMEL